MMKKLLCTLILTVVSVGFINAQADINIQGNGVTIVSGDTTPDAADDTDFGQVSVGSTSTITYTIQNTGTSDLFISLPPGLTGSSDFSVTTNPSFIIPAASSSTFNVQYAPSAVGVVTGTISVTSNDPDVGENPYTFDIQGEGIVSTDPDINIQGNGIDIVNGDTTPDIADDTDFGQVSIGSSLTRTYTIQNTGASNLFISLPPGLTGSSDFSVTANPSFLIAPASFSTFDVEFLPTSVGILTATISISSNDPDESPYTFDIQAEGTPINEPDITVLGNGITISDGDTTPDSADDTDFGVVAIGGTITRTFTVENEGAQTLFVSVPTLTGSSTFTVTSNPAFSVGPGLTTTFDIEFAPTTVGIAVAQVSIASNDPDAENPYTFDIQAEGIVLFVPDINIQGNSIDIVDGDTTPDVADDTDFGIVNVGNNLSVIYTVQNTGNDDLFVSPPTLTGSSDFTVIANPAFSVGPGLTTTFEILYTPSAIGVATSTVSISSNDPDAENPYTFVIQGEGVLNEPEMDVFGNGLEIVSGDITPSAGDNTDFGQVDVTSGNLANTFTIENNGIIDLNLTDPNPYITISGLNAGDFTITSVPSTPIATLSSTTFSITFNPSAIGIRTASVSIANDDTDENPYTFNIQGEGIDANAGSPLLITQYYEGNGDPVTDTNRWIEVKNVSTSLTLPGAFYLVLWVDLDGTINGGIASNVPEESVLIPALSPGEVALFSRTGALLPTAANRGPVSITATEVCSFNGNDIIAISTTNDFNAYNSRIDIIGTVGVNTAVNWGANTSRVKGCGVSESPSLTYDANQYITLTLDEVDNASNFVGSPSLPNLALGVQTVGPTIWNGSSWDNGLPGKTKQTIINGTYNATNGSFESCDLVVNGGASINFDNGTTNYVLVDDDLTVNGSFTVGDTESLVMTNADAIISGQISKIEVTTSLNNYRDFTYWSSPVNTTIANAFVGVNPNRIYRWDRPGIESPTGGGWSIASGAMTAARGYIAEAPIGSTQHTVTFTGTPNNGLVSMQVGFLNDGFEYTDYNLIGNPYPSAINIDQFIELVNNAEIRDNDDLDGTIYLWTHSTQISGGTEGDFTDTDYATYNLVGGTASSNGGPVPTNNIGSGQGFMVRAKSTGTVFFENDMRLNDENNQFFKSNQVEEEKNRMWLDMTSEQGAFNQILIGFFDEATDGVDRGYDGLKNNGGSFISFYSKIDDSRYVIQGLGAFDQSKEVTLGFDTGIARTFKIAISNIEGDLKDEDVYLVDNALNIVHDLKQGAYEFEITETGVYSERFTLKFNNAVLDVEDLDFGKDFLVINEDNTLRIKANQEVAKIKVFDVLGRLLIDQKPNESDFYMNTTNIKKGTILILNATMQDGSTVSKKAIKY